MKKMSFLKYQLNANNPITMVSGPQGQAANFNFGGGSKPSNPMQQNVQNLDTPPFPGQDPNKQQQQQPDDKNKQGSSPLDAFSTLFDNPVPNKDDKTAQPKPTIFDAKPEDIQKLAEKVDVSGMLDAETLKALNPTNSPEVTKALQTAFNSVAKGVFQQSVVAALNIGKQSMDLGTNRATDATLQRVNQDSARTMLVKDMPILNHPAYAPLVKSAMEQMIKHNPGADAHTLYTKAKEYFSHLNVQGEQKDDNNKAGEDTGLGDFFNFNN